MPSALITGGTGGLGGAVTARFLASGWRCVVPYADERQAHALREQTDAAATERLVLVQADLLDESALAHAIATTNLDDAPFAALLNLVGGFDAPGRVHEVPVARFEEQLRLNLRATYLATAAVLPAMIERKEGAIACVSSRAALAPFAGAAGYITAKAAVLAFVDALAAEYTAQGIRANAILPSVIDTPANRAAQPDADHLRWVPPEEIAAVLEFLCSEQAASISGAHVPVYGRA